MKEIKKWLLEGVKTAARFGILAFLTVLADVLRKSLDGGSFDETTKWTILLGLAGLDKFVYLWKKETGAVKVMGIDWKGISPV